MHELSIVTSVVESVTESLAAYPGARVLEVRLRVGALASVVRESLEFCYGIAAEETALKGLFTTRGCGLCRYQKWISGNCPLAN